MSRLLTTIEQHTEDQQLGQGLVDAAEFLNNLIDPDAYVGEVYSLGYESALVQIHDFHRRQVGGIPALAFLIATRVNPTKPIDVREEDSSVILLRVLDRADLPNAPEALRVRVENAQRVSGELDKSWDHRDVMDPTTHHLLSYAGIRCRVLGTFYIVDIGDDGQPRYALSFGSDLSNYYPNCGLKVFKPRGKMLARIVNYRDPQTHKESDGAMVKIGEVRYASTNRQFQQIAGVPVAITPTDLLAQKTALFGMTRTGKSNTTKIILKSIFALRWLTPPRQIGQIVFDYNGEYANENQQDADSNQNASAIKNVWACGPPGKHRELRDSIVTYGITQHPNDPNRKLMRLNFYMDSNLQAGKDIIDSALSEDTSTKYITHFCNVRLEPPDQKDHSAMTRHNRRVLCYRALLFKAGLEPPDTIRPVVRGLIGQDFINAMRQSGGKDATAAADYQAAAALLAKPNLTWAEMDQACRALRDYIMDGKSGFPAFDQDYMQKSSTGSWADDNLKKILEMFDYPNGSRLVGRVKEQHTSSTSTDYADDIYHRTYAPFFPGISAI
jgi:Helicase HerA, central domain